ncbi:MAG: hypothetical protein J6Y04_05220 [Bacteroidaceae bacterium]|nr:hypothetical protein [Bacteroidaceae bacterium]
MDDRQFDEIIMQAVERKQTLAELDRVIIRDVKRKARREWMRKWARIVVFSFGMPFLLLIFAAGIYFASTVGDLRMYRLVLIIPCATILYFGWRLMKDFSIEDV